MSKKEINDERICLQLPSETKLMLKKIAEQQDKNVNQIIRELLRKFVKENYKEDLFN